LASTPKSSRDQCVFVPTTVFLARPWCFGGDSRVVDATVVFLRQSRKFAPNNKKPPSPALESTDF
jgi:hypothetical protein